jgi:integrase
MQVISERPARITKTTIEAAWRRRKPDQRLIVRDQECRGLALIVNQTGMAWIYAYRPRGTDPLTGRRWPNRTVTIGNPATHSPDDARTEANRLKGQAQAGADPIAERKAQAVAGQKKRGTPLARLAEDYGRAMPRRQKLRGSGHPSPTYVAEELAQLRLALAAMGTNEMAATDLGSADIRRLLEGEGATNTHSRFGAVSRFLDWCQDEGHIETNPCVLLPRTRRPKAPQARSHYLAPVDLARLWEAAERLREPVWRDFTRFLIAVPCRRGEAARLDWSHLDLRAAEWRQPAHMTKNRDPHRLHLHALALEVLVTRRKAYAEAAAAGDDQKATQILAAGHPRSGLVFPSPVSETVIDTFSGIKSALTNATGPREGGEDAVELTGWTWHDFRRSFASALGEAGIPEAVADAVLNHRQGATRGGVLGVYQRSSRWPEQLRAMHLWGQLLATALRGADGATNVALDREASP